MMSLGGRGGKTYSKWVLSHSGTAVQLIQLELPSHYFIDDILISVDSPINHLPKWKVFKRLFSTTYLKFSVHSVFWFAWNTVMELQRVTTRRDSPPSRSSSSPTGAELCVSSTGPPKESTGASSYPQGSMEGRKGWEVSPGTQNETQWRGG